MKPSNLLKLLLAPFFMYAGEEGGGGAEDRGDLLPADNADDTVVDDEIVDPMKDDKVEDKAEDKTDDEKKESRIPLSRHKEMLEKGRIEREALVAELNQLKAGTKATQTNADIDATEAKLTTMEADYNKLLADGEIEKATAKMTEIRRLERTINDQKSDMKAEAAEARAVERVRYDTIVERLESAYPQINPDHDDFDKEVVAEVLELQSAYTLKGLSPSAALQKAVKYVIGAETVKQEKAASVTPNVSAEDLAKARKQEALKRNIDAAKRTPASTTKVGQNNDDKGGTMTGEQAMKLSQSEFAKLDEKSLAQMRGDEL